MPSAPPRGNALINSTIESVTQDDDRIRAAAALAAAARERLARERTRNHPVDPEPPAFTVEQASRIVEVLNRHGVDYVVIGGFAAVLHGAPVPPTRDLDITPERTTANLDRLISALRDLAAKLRTLGGPPDGVDIHLDSHTFDHMITMTFVTSHGPLDIGFRPDGTTGYRDLILAAETIELGGSRAPVASLADIIRSKEAAGRAKDLAVLPALTVYLASRHDQEAPE